MRLIDADALEEHKFNGNEFVRTDYQQGWNDAMDAIIDNAPTIEERPKGEWIERVEHRGCYLGVKTVYSYTCPFCGVKEYEKHPFCHCGADMRSVVDEGLHERAISDLSKAVDDAYKKARGDV